MSMRSGKTVKLIRRALDEDGTIFVSSVKSAQHIIDTAKKLGLKKPKILVYQKYQGPLPVTPKGE